MLTGYLISEVPLFIGEILVVANGQITYSRQVDLVKR